MYLINKIEWKSFILRLIVLVDFVTGGDGGEAVEGWLHCERWGVSQLLRSRESRLPGRHQKGVSNRRIEFLRLSDFKAQKDK